MVYLTKDVQSVFIVDFFSPAICSLSERSQQALNHNYDIYRRSLNQDRVIESLGMINQILLDNQGLAAYELRYGMTAP
jgi:hypothetical protein